MNSMAIASFIAAAVTPLVVLNRRLLLGLGCLPMAIGKARQ
jgi:hypothetical protein